MDMTHGPLAGKILRFAVPLALFASIVSVVAGLVFSRLFFG